MGCWLVKSEPDVFSIDDLEKAPKKTTCWEGVRNYQARNVMRDQMKKGDRVYYYHSNCEEPGIAGICQVVKEGYPDYHAFDPQERYYDPKSDPDNPRWYMVDLRFRRKLRRLISLAELRRHADQLDGLALLRKGNRLSVLPVADEHWAYVLGLE